MTDQELDRALSSALDLEPRADFLARVRMGVAAEPAPSNWLVPIRLAGAAALMVVAAAAGVVFWNDAEEPQVGTVVRVAASPEIVTVQPEAPVTAKSEAPTRTSTSAAAATVAANPLPRPIISIDDARSVDLLLAASGHSGGSADLLPRANAPDGPIELAALKVPLLVPEPSIQMDRLEAGERQ